MEFKRPRQVGKCVQLPKWFPKYRHTFPSSGLGVNVAALAWRCDALPLETVAVTVAGEVRFVVTFLRAEVLSAFTQSLGLKSLTMLSSLCDRKWMLRRYSAQLNYVFIANATSL